MNSTILLIFIFDVLTCTVVATQKVQINKKCK